MPPTEQTRAKIHELYFYYSPPPADQNTDITVQALDEAIDAVWDWGSNNAANLAANLPQPFRGRTNAEQKWLLLVIMASTRTGDLIDLTPVDSGGG